MPAAIRCFSSQFRSSIRLQAGMSPASSGLDKRVHQRHHLFHAGEGFRDLQVGVLRGQDRVRAAGNPRVVEQQNGGNFPLGRIGHAQRRLQDGPVGLKGEFVESPVSRRVLVLPADRFAQDVDLNPAGVPGKLLGGHQHVLVGVEGIAAGRR